MFSLVGSVALSFAFLSCYFLPLFLCFLSPSSPCFCSKLFWFSVQLRSVWFPLNFLLFCLSMLTFVFLSSKQMTQNSSSEAFSATSIDVKLIQKSSLTWKLTFCSKSCLSWEPDLLHLPLLCQMPKLSAIVKCRNFKATSFCWRRVTNERKWRQQRNFSRPCELEWKPFFTGGSKTSAMHSMHTTQSELTCLEGRNSIGMFYCCSNRDIAIVTGKAWNFSQWLL